MTVHKDCINIVVTVWLIGIAVAFPLLYFIPAPYTFISYLLAAPVMFIMGFVLFFFRVPERPVVPGEEVVTSVADGEVVIVDKVFEGEYLKRDVIQVSVYMDFFNVHVNFWPISGEVTYYKYHPGLYMLAFLPKASELNEHASVGIRSRYGEILFKQLAGTFARRIVTYAEPGSHADKGTQCGIIKFGSRIDMYLPLDAEINVKVGDAVNASTTVIAHLKRS